MTPSRKKKEKLLDSKGREKEYKRVAEGKCIAYVMGSWQKVSSSFKGIQEKEATWITQPRKNQL